VTSRRLGRSIRARAQSVVRTIGNATARVNPEPVIVLGKEKSGTTAIAALLARHADLTVTLDIRALFGRVSESIIAGDLSFEVVMRRARRDFSRDIIKQPSLTWMYPQLRRRLPGARYVIIVRDPRDNIRSVFNRVGLPGTLRDIDDRQYAELPKHWHWNFTRPGVLALPGDNYIEHAAERWNRATDVYLEHSDEMLLVRYEDFVADKLRFVYDLAEALGLRHAVDISAEADRQYQRRGDRGVTWEEFFGRRNLATIERVTADRMRAMGYAPSTLRAG
jgi:hypothetical protein